MSEIFKFQTPRPMSDITIQLEKDITNCPTLTYLYKLKAKNRFRIAGSLKLDEAFRAREAELKSKRKGTQRLLVDDDQYYPDSTV